MPQVKIEKIVVGGAGMGRIDNQVVFVPFSAPQDLLEIEITEKSTNFMIGKIKAILEASPLREKPPCPVFELCGGCQIQHLNYPAQVSEKLNLVKEALTKFLNKQPQSGFDQLALAIEKSPKDFSYRNRIQLHKEKNQVGYFAPKSHKLIPIEACLIAEDSLNEKMKELRSNSKLKDGRYEITLNSELNPEIKSSDSEESYLTFSQVNRFQNEKLIEYVLSLAKDGAFDQIYDLYSGSGNFTFPLFNLFRSAKVSAVELNPTAIDFGQSKLRAMNISPKKAAFYLSDVESFLKQTPLNPNSLVILDPPRDGCSEKVIKYLGLQKVKKIIYISCHPASLGRDLERFFQISQQNYRMTSIKCFDMFPQTAHVETVVNIELKQP